MTPNPRKRSKIELKYAARLGFQGQPPTEVTIQDELRKWRDEGDQGFIQWYFSQEESLRDTCFASKRIKKYFEEARTVYPKLSRIAEILSRTPGCSSSIERLFSRCSHIMTPSRSTLDTARIEQQLLLYTTDGISEFFQS